MSASKLVKPDIIYKDSYIEALREFQAEGRYTFLKVDDIEENFEQFIADINSGKKHLHKPYEDWVEPVPETILWFVKENKFIGALNIRHRLNWHLEKWGGHINFLIRPTMRNLGFGKKLMQKAISCTCYLGVDRALLTIDPDDIAAQKILDFVGAQFEDELTTTEQFPAKKRYWLECN